MAISITTTSVGTPVERLFGDLVLGCQTLERNVAQILMGYQEDGIVINRLYSGNQAIIAAVATPSATADNTTKDEVLISPAEIMYYDEFNPKNFNVDWKMLWAEGPEVRQRAAQNLLNALLPSVRTSFNYDLEKLLWQGDTGSASAWLDPIDGFVKLIDADTTVNSVTPAGAVTASNVIAILQAVLDAAPDAVIENSAPTIVTNHTIKRLYHNAIAALPNKGTDITDSARNTFMGYPITSVHGVPANRIFMMNTGQDDRAALKVGTWMEGDRFNVLIDRKQANSDLFFIKINMVVGVNHVYGKEIVEYSPA
jgi:hypothetical protein